MISYQPWFGVEPFLDITQFRAPPCRIIYSLDHAMNFLKRNYLEESFALSPYKYRTSEQFQSITSKEHVYLLIFLPDKNVFHKYKWGIQAIGLEFLGLLEIGKDGANWEICLLIVAYKIVETESHPSFVLQADKNIVENFEAFRTPPTKWITEEGLGSSENLWTEDNSQKSDLVTLTLS